VIGQRDRTLARGLGVVAGEVCRLPAIRGGRFAVVVQADERLALHTVLVAPTSRSAPPPRPRRRAAMRRSWPGAIMPAAPLAELPRAHSARPFAGSVAPPVAHPLDVIGVPARPQRRSALGTAPARGEEQGDPSGATKARTPMREEFRSRAT
jgi:hypothetical protein